MHDAMSSAADFYDLHLFPNLMRYRTPQKDVNTAASSANTRNNNSNTSAPQSQAQEQTHTPQPTKCKPSQSRKTIYARLNAWQHPSEISAGSEWCWCPSCGTNKICVTIGRCVANGERVKVLFRRLSERL